MKLIIGKYKSIIITVAISIELIVVFYLFALIREKYIKNGVLGSFRASPINHNELIFPADSRFKYYTALVPSQNNKDRLFWTTDTYAHYTINKDGLNDRYDYPIQKEKNTYRIIALGDSFTYGFFVDTKNNWTEQLEDMLNKQHTCKNIKKFDVINLGMPAFDIPYIVKRYQDYGIKYNPDLIIWFESGTGYTRINELMQPYVQKCNLQDSNHAAALASKDLNNKCWSDGEKLMFERYPLNKIEDYLTNQVQLFLKIRDKTPVLFSTFVNTNQNMKKLMQERIKNQMNAYFDDSVSNIYDLDGALPDGHPNIKGHKIIADDLVSYLEKNRIIPCN